MIEVAALVREHRERCGRCTDRPCFYCLTADTLEALARERDEAMSRAMEACTAVVGDKLYFAKQRAGRAEAEVRLRDEALKPLAALAELQHQNEDTMHRDILLVHRSVLRQAAAALRGEEYEEPPAGLAATCPDDAQESDDG